MSASGTVSSGASYQLYHSELRYEQSGPPDGGVAFRSCDQVRQDWRLALTNGQPSLGASGEESRGMGGRVRA